MQSSVSPTHFLQIINGEYENIFASAAQIAKEMNDIEDSKLAAKRTFGYNPKSQRIFDMFPEYKQIIDELTDFINSLRNSIKTHNQTSQLPLLGCCYLTLGDFPNAFSVFVGLLPSFQTAENSLVYAMGIVFAHYKYDKDALKCFTKVSTDTNFPLKDELTLRIAFLYRHMGNFDSAIKLFKEIQRAPPRDLTPDDISLQIAYTHQLKGNYPIAIDIYRDLFQKYRGNLSILQQYALFLFLQNTESDLIASKAIIAEALSKYPFDPILLIIAARIAMKQNDMSTAYAYYQSSFCAPYYSLFPYFWCGLGVLYYKNGQAHDAIVAFQRALFLKSEIPEAWLNIGLIFQQEGDIQKAVKVYEQGLANCPNCHYFNERINAINSQRANHRKINLDLSIIEIPDSEFIISVAEQFANDFIMATPSLPINCYGKELETASQYEVLSTYPKSLFL